MKQLFLILVLILSISSQAQTKTITKYAQVVPKGKKWVIPLNQKFLVNFESGSLQRGTYCNSILNSDDAYLMSVIETYDEYGVQTKNAYNIKISTIKKSIGHPTVYEVVSSGYDRIMTEGSSSLNEMVKRQSLTFYEGQIVKLNSCLVELEIIESTFTDKDKDFLSKLQRKEELEAKKAQEEYEREKEILEKEKFKECENEKEDYEWWVKNKGLIFEAKDVTFLPELLESKGSLPEIIRHRIINTLRPLNTLEDKFKIYVMYDSRIIVPDECLGCEIDLVPALSFKPGIKTNHACNMNIPMNNAITINLTYKEFPYKQSKPFTITYKIKNGEIKNHHLSIPLSQTKCTEEELKEFLTSDEVKKLDNGYHNFKYSKKNITYELRMNIQGDFYNKLIIEGNFTLIEKL